MGDRNSGRTLEANFGLAYPYPCPDPYPSLYNPHPYPCPYPFRYQANQLTPLPPFPFFCPSRSTPTQYFHHG
jgi:hypothetical protein